MGQVSFIIFLLAIKDWLYKRHAFAGTTFFYLPLFKTERFYFLFERIKAIMIHVYLETINYYNFISANKTHS